MTMKKDIPAENMDAESMDAVDMVRIIPAAAAGTILHWKEKMQEKHAEYITGVHLMTVLSLILLMIVENHWNSYVVPV